MTTENDNQPSPPWSIIWRVFGGFLILFSAYTVFAWRASGDTKMSTFGDTFGAFNALFAGFGFIGLAFTIYLQNQQLRIQQYELKLQRDELKMNREQLTRSAKAQEDSERALSKQLRVMSFSSRLSAITMQLGLTYDHTEGHPNTIHVRKYSDSSLEDYLVKANNRIIKGQAYPDDKCVVNDLKVIIELRKDLAGINAELRNLI